MSARAPAAWLAVPGALDAPTGGYAYARRVLRAAGGLLGHLPLPGGFPDPSPAQIEGALKALSLARGPVAIDGLALGVLPAEGVAALAGPVIGLLHHPLGLETGLEPARARALLQSEGAALRACAAVVTTSAATAHAAAELFVLDPARVHVAPPGLARAAPARGAEPGAPRLILGVGALTPRKGWDVLLRALAALGPGAWRCAIVGAHDRDPAEAARLRALIAQLGLEERATLTGALDAPALERMFARADIFCLPSRYEGYGMAAAEAMMRALPVVATHAVREAAPPGAALLVPPDDPEALADALALLLSRPEARRRLAQAARAHAMTLPDWDETARRILRVVRDARGAPSAAARA
ncbi:glycosyltransferase family 4 protein [Oceanicella actignis]|uniref:glycosyltransferase family 4 protein n=1 Tax=Oceanicella actignis TaxID=1189325 RepID=UPI0011E724E3|nr:glycosyltransferase family 4 protein [Oceanicella actignis]TYO91340.1 glycosyltransferase involved in cell wall biosynthesis [Oceanicella actignis]